MPCHEEVNGLDSSMCFFLFSFFLAVVCHHKEEAHNYTELATETEAISSVMLPECMVLVILPYCMEVLLRILNDLRHKELGRWATRSSPLMEHTPQPKLVP